MVIEAVCVSVAMYCLIQFYYQIRNDIKQHSPFLKILSIKLVIFLSFWQTVSFLIFVLFFPLFSCLAVNRLTYVDPHLLPRIFRRHQSH